MLKPNGSRNKRNGSIRIIFLLMILNTAISFSDMPLYMKDTPLATPIELPKAEGDTTKKIILFKNENRYLPLKNVFKDTFSGEYSIIKEDYSTNVFLESKFGALCDTREEFRQDLKIEKKDYLDSKMIYVGQTVMRKYYIMLLQQ